MSQARAPGESPCKSPTRGPRLVECAAANAESPPVVVSIIPIHCKLFICLFCTSLYYIGLLACSLACLTFILLYIAIDYTSNTMKYHESVGRIGTSAAGTSANTLSRRVIFYGIRSIIYLSCTHAQISVPSNNISKTLLLVVQRIF